MPVAARSDELSATGTAIGLWNRLQAFWLDVTAATTAAKVLAALHARERHVDLLQHVSRGLLDAMQDLLVLALRRLIGEIRDQWLAFVTQVSRNGLAPTE